MQNPLPPPPPKSCMFMGTSELGADSIHRIDTAITAFMNDPAYTFIEERILQAINALKAEESGAGPLTAKGQDVILRSRGGQAALRSMLDGRMGLAGAIRQAREELEMNLPGGNGHAED